MKKKKMRKFLVEMISNNADLQMEIIELQEEKGKLAQEVVDIRNELYDWKTRGSKCCK